MKKMMRKYFLRGVLITLPIGGTILLCQSIYQFIYDAVIVHIYVVLNYFGIQSLAVVNVAILLVLIFIIGILGGNFVGRRIIFLLNKIIEKMPLINLIYGTLQQLLGAIFQDNNKFSKVVLIEYPRKGLYSIAFVTTEEKHASLKGKEDLWSVFIPTTPNPTSGILLFVPQEECQVLDMSVNKAAKLIMSAGIVSEDKNDLAQK